MLKCATKLDSPRSPKAGPRICKPEEKFQQQPETDIRAIRGRRKPLYSTPTNRSTMPPQIPPKPAIGMYTLTIKNHMLYQRNLVSAVFSQNIYIPWLSSQFTNNENSFTFLRNYYENDLDIIELFFKKGFF